MGKKKKTNNDAVSLQQNLQHPTPRLTNGLTARLRGPASPTLPGSHVNIQDQS